jgi:hypothetical protein
MASINWTVAFLSYIFSEMEPGREFYLQLLRFYMEINFIVFTFSFQIGAGIV